VTNRPLRLWLTAVALALPGLAGASTALPNGLTIVPVYAPGTHVCGVHVALRIGPERVPPSKAGLRALTQQLILSRIRGAIRQRPELASLRSEAAEGASFSVETQWDDVEFATSVTEGDLPELLSFLGPAIFAATWEQDDVVAAREAISNDDESASAGGVGANVFSLFLQALTGDPAQGQPLYGTEETRGNVTLADVKAYYRAYYVPNLASVCLVSPLADADATELVRKAFGSYPARDGLSAAAAAPSPAADRVQVGSSPQLRDAVLMVGVPLPPVSSPDFPVARIIEAALSGTGGRAATLTLPGRSGLSMRDALKRESVFDVVPVPMSAHPYLALFGRVSPTTIEAARGLMLQTLLGFARQPMSDDELARARTRAMNQEAVAVERPGDAATLINQAALLGEVYPSDKAFAERVTAVTAADVQEFARREFTRHAVGLLMPGD
jgi:zinc protease